MTSTSPADYERLGYFRAVARSVGIPPLWLDDCAQECALAVWQAGDERMWKIVARHTAIEFARRYGRRDRAGNPRGEMISTAGMQMLIDDLKGRARDISEAYFRRRVIAVLSAPDTLSPHLDCLDAADAIAKLTPAQRRHLFNRESGVNNDTLRYQARQKLRKLCA